MRPMRQRLGQLAFGMLLFACSVARAQIEPRPPIPAGWTDLSPGVGSPTARVDPQLVRYIQARAFAAFAIDLRPGSSGDKMWIDRPVPRSDINERTAQTFAEQLSSNGQGRIIEQKTCTVGGQPAAKLVLESTDGKYMTLIYTYHLRNGKEDVIAAYQASKKRFARLRASFEKLEGAAEISRH